MRPAKGTFSLAGLLGLLAVAAVLLTLCTGLWREYDRAWANTHDSVFQGRMKQTALGLHNYLDTYGTMPPVGSPSPTKPICSWRVSVLPFLEQQALFAAYRQDLPWNDPINNALCRGVPRPLDEHTRHRNVHDRCTNIVAVTGPGTMWPPEGPRRLSDITDNHDSTIILVEIARSDIAWHEPRDIDIAEVSFVGGPGLRRIGRHRPGGAHVVTANGQVRFLPDSTPPETLRAMLTIAGGEDVPELK